MTAVAVERAPHCLDIKVMEMEPLWVLLWSQSQNALHLEPLEDMQKANVEAFTENRRMDYVPLHVGTRESVHAAAEDVRPICRARAEARTAQEIRQ